jgi:hypothetical protein
MKAVDWRKIAISLRIPPAGVLSVTPGYDSHEKRGQERVSAPTLAVPEQECTGDDTLSENPCVPLLLISSTQL